MAYSTNISQVLQPIFFTDSCLAQQTNFLLTIMDKRRFWRFFPYWHDFDRPQEGVWHTSPQTSFWKIIYSGFKTSVIKWFVSDLSNRKIFISLNEVYSETGIWNSGVPEGSILGPILILIYINDLPQSETAFYLCAVNTCIFYQDKKIH